MMIWVARRLAVVQAPMTGSLPLALSSRLIGTLMAIVVTLNSAVLFVGAP